MNYSREFIDEKYPAVLQGETSVLENHIVSYNVGTIPKQAQMSCAAVEQADAIINVIDHKVRQQIIKMLAEKERVKVGDIFKKLGLNQSITSVHLAILRRSDIVVNERCGRNIYYSLNYARIAEIIDFVKCVVSYQKEIN